MDEQLGFGGMEKICRKVLFLLESIVYVPSAEVGAERLLLLLDCHLDSSGGCHLRLGQSQCRADGLMLGQCLLGLLQLLLVLALLLVLHSAVLEPNLHLKPINSSMF